MARSGPRERFVRRGDGCIARATPPRQTKMATMAPGMNRPAGEAGDTGDAPTIGFPSCDPFPQ
jgi:hypothetical protein